MENLDERLKEVMASVFNTDSDQITADSSQKTVEGWDSVAHLDLIVALEEEFDISIPIEDVGSLSTYALVREEVERLSE